MDCQHELIEDEFVVCKKCGYVQDNLLLPTPSLTQREAFYSEVSKSLKDEICDLIFYFNLPLNIIEEIYYKVTTDERQYLTNKEKTALHLYSSVMDLGNYIRFYDICHACFVNPKKIIKYCTYKCHFNSMDILNKVCKNLDLNSGEMKLIEKKLLNRPTTGHNPYTTIAAFIYTTFSNKFSLTEICTAANINPVSVRRYINKYIHNTT